MSEAGSRRIVCDVRIRRRSQDVQDARASSRGQTGPFEGPHLGSPSIASLRIGRVVVVSAAVWALFGVACGEGGPASPTPAEPTSPGAPASPPTGSRPGETIEVIGRDVKFDKGELEVPADTPFTIVFDHQDAGVPHNFAIYQSGPPATDLILKTEIQTGPTIQELAVGGLPAGSYFYQCDVHPATMRGTLEVN